MGEESPVTGQEVPAAAPEEEINLLDLLIVVVKHKKTILSVTFGAAVVSLVVAFLLPNVYTGRAVIMPPQQQSNVASALLGQLGALAGGGAGSALGLKNPGDLYAGMLKGRTVADNLIQRFRLQEFYGTGTMVETRKELADDTAISAGRDGLIVIEFESTDPGRAADIANGYVEELDRLTQSIAVTEAAQRRLFFERQLAQGKKDLAEAERKMQKTQETTGIIKLDDQGKAIIEAIALVRAQITAKEVQLSSMRLFATSQNPDYIRTQQELAGLKAELVKMEKTNTGGQGDFFMATGKVPEAGLEYIRSLRDVKYYEAIFELLAKQFELAKIDEAKDAAVIQVVDKAVAPDRKSKPRRALIVVLTTLVAGVLAVLWVFAREAFEKTKTNPETTERLGMLKGLLRLR